MRVPGAVLAREYATILNLADRRDVATLWKRLEKLTGEYEGEAFDFIMDRVDIGFAVPVRALARMASGSGEILGKDGDAKRFLKVEKWLATKGYASEMVRGFMVYRKRSAAKCS